MNSSGPISPRRGVVYTDKSGKMPEVLQHLLCGRIVEIKTEAGGTLEGEVREFASLDVVQAEDGATSFGGFYNVEWMDARNPAERSRDTLHDSVIRKMMTDRFTDAPWFASHIKHLQKADWVPDKVDKAACQHDEAVNSALRNAGIARKAALHAQAMLCALEGTKLVIPPPPGVPDHSRAADVPLFMPHKQYSTLGQAAKGPSPPIAWKLKASRNVSAEEKRDGRRLASEAEALREWVRLQRAQLAKLQKRNTNRARLRKITARVAELKAALEQWDEASPPQFLSSPVAGKGKAADAGGKLLSKEDVEDSVAGYEVEILDITATGEVLSGDAKEEAEVDAHIEADIADQLEVLRQAEELVPRAEQSLKDFETTMGLTRVRAPGRGVPGTTAGAGKAAAAKAAPTRKPASGSAVAGKGAKKAKAHPETATAVGAKASKASPKKAKKTEAVVMPPAGSDFATDSDGDAMMADPEPSRRDRALWAGEELVYLSGRFFPKTYVMKEGDMPVEEWTEKEAAGEIAAEYEVDALVAEQGQGERRTFLVKWKGYELHPEQWLPYGDFALCKALDVWENGKAACKGS
ncbi:g5411 [Coccomyxa viridis]|uniref:G5411 protein n=1 Tax=Coccomyxa viridis TaxID=1274662 RepID=A0ABP1FSR7_9CHLO